MEQLQLLLKDSKKKVSLDVIASQKTFLDAIKLSQSIAGLDDKVICSELEVDPGQWSRIKTGQAHFPCNKLMQYMSLCENIIPLIWLAHSSGYSIVPLKTELEEENERLKAELEEQKKEIEILTKYKKAGII